MARNILFFIPTVPPKTKLLAVRIFVKTPKMIDQIFEAIHAVMPVLYVLAALAIIAKVVIVINNKGWRLPVIVFSFFRIYSKSQRNTSTRKKTYMQVNNYINYYLYIFAFLFIMLLIIYQKNIFYYPR